MRRAVWTLFAIPLVASLGCQPPVLSSLNLAQGPEHTLVQVSGSNLFASSVLWDAGLGSEQTIPGGFLGGYMFSVPPGETVGNHPVALRNSQGTSGTRDFVVTPVQPFGPPRIDRVTLAGTSFDAAGQVNVGLYVQGANIDVGAVVEIDGADVATAAHQGLRNGLFGTTPTILGYPIYHYLGLIALPQVPKAPGSTLQIQVRNLDGVRSAAFPYALPTDAASIDSDGDALLDTWEENGYDADGDGTLEVDLPTLGADPFRPDIFVEMDVMQGLANPPIAAAGANPGVFQAAQQMFAAAPVLNPFRASGINLFIDSSGSIPNTATLHFGTIIGGNGTSTDFATIRNANFTAARDDVFHYGIWGDALVGGISGVSDVDFGGSEVGDDFLVSFDNFQNSFQTLRSQVETFVHELGHGLGQRHGGATHRRFNPQYWSAMSYTWQLRSGQSNGTRRTRVTCAPIYWANAAATEPNGAAPANPNAITDYSHGMGPTVVENTGSLQEATGVCGAAVDWNDDGDTTDTNLSVDANNDGTNNETLVDVSNWAGLRFNGPADDGDL
jgi:hypothetical protein